MATNFHAGRPLPTTVEGFWEFCDDARLAEEFTYDRDLQFLQRAPLDVVRRIAFHYRFFTGAYIDDLAQLISRLPFSGLKSYFAAVLSDELGHGDPDKTHLAMYDGFLVSLGMTDREAFARRADPRILGLTAELARLTRSESLAYVLGLRGMGAECLCQVYLMHKTRRLRDNPAIRALGTAVDWAFHDYHAGEADVEHRRQTRRLIGEFLVASPDEVTACARGYTRAREIWKRFWDIAYEGYTARIRRAG